MTPNFHESADDSDEKSRPDDPTGWRAVYESSLNGLRAFLRGRLGQEADVEDCLQFVLMKMIESGAEVTPRARRAWLFRVAANESARIWRRKSATDRAMEKQASSVNESIDVDATDKVIQNETKHQLRKAIEHLPETTQVIIRMRIHDDLTFQEIADKLNIPLGTALTRMRRGLERLRNEIDENQSDDQF